MLYLVCDLHSRYSIRYWAYKLASRHHQEHVMLLWARLGDMERGILEDSIALSSIFCHLRSLIRRIDGMTAFVAPPQC